MDRVPEMFRNVRRQQVRVGDGRVDPETYMEYLMLSMKSVQTPTDIQGELAKLNAKAATKKKEALARGESTENWPNAGALIFRVE